MIISDNLIKFAYKNVIVEKQLNIAEYLDSTYLKTADEAGITELENNKIILQVIDEAISNKFACVMIRPDFVLMAIERINFFKSKIKVGTVVDFPFGDSDTSSKLKEAKVAIDNGAFDIDFVCDYNAFKRKSFEKFDLDILEGTKKCLENKKIAKWIIETGALSKNEIKEISRRISKIVYMNFPKSIDKVFIKTSTGYYGGYGATVRDVKLIKSESRDLKIKASGGISNFTDAFQLIQAGADRIGTSKAKLIYDQQKKY